MMGIRMSIARCCCIDEIDYGCNPEGISYGANNILDTTGVTVTSNATNWSANLTANRLAGLPFTPSASYSNFNLSNGSPPSGSYYDIGSIVGTDPAFWDFSTADNSISLFSSASYGSLISTGSRRLSLDGGSTTGRFNNWNPCDKNTLHFSFTQARDVTVPSGGWGSASSNSTDTKLSVVGTGFGVTPSATVQPFIEYDRATGNYDNGVIVTDASGTSTTYSFGSTSTSSADVDIKLKITPVTPVITSPMLNRWLIEFDITGDGSSLSIPSYEFSIGRGNFIKTEQYFAYNCFTEDFDKYKFSDVSIGLTTT